MKYIGIEKKEKRHIKSKKPIAFSLLFYALLLMFYWLGKPFFFVYTRIFFKMFYVKSFLGKVHFNYLWFDPFTSCLPFFKNRGKNVFLLSLIFSPLLSPILPNQKLRSNMTEFANSNRYGILFNTKTLG